MKIVSAISMLAAVVLAVSGAKAQTVTVSVSSFATGKFGDNAAAALPLVKALSVTAPGTFVISAAQTARWCVAVCPSAPSREIIVCGAAECVTPAGPNGVWSSALGVKKFTPLQQVIGASNGEVSNWGALIGAFVPRSDALAAGFTAVDQTKLTTGVGVSPSELFFIGARKSIRVDGAGTLFLGVNDNFAQDNDGAISVTVRFIPAQVLYGSEMR